jgi:hypothetical protein
MIFLNLFLAILLENFNSEEELNDDKAEILNFASHAKSYIISLFDKLVSFFNLSFILIKFIISKNYHRISATVRGTQ